MPVTVPKAGKMTGMYSSNQGPDPTESFAFKTSLGGLKTREAYGGPTTDTKRGIIKTSLQLQTNLN